MEEKMNKPRRRKRNEGNLEEELKEIWKRRWINHKEQKKDVTNCLQC